MGHLDGKEGGTCDSHGEEDEGEGVRGIVIGEG